MRCDLENNVPEKIEIHHPVGANHGGAKGALEIADVGDFDVDLVESR